MAIEDNTPANGESRNTKRAEYKKAWYEKNKERIRAQQKERRTTDPDVIAQRKRYSKGYYRKNKQRIDEQNKAYAEAHKEEVNARRRKGPRVRLPREERRARKTEWERKWRQAHPKEATARSLRYYYRNRDNRRDYYLRTREIKKEARTAYNRAYKQRNLDKHALKEARRRARLLNAPVSDFTLEQWRDALAAFNYHCAYCLRGADTLSQDHVQPLSRGGPHTRTNIIPACQSCNSSKGSKTLFEFLMASGRR